MPEISRFYGIVIKMFFKPREHEPSHLHALYGENIGIFDLRTMEMTEGDLPRKAQDLVKEWMKKNQTELLQMWDTQNLKKLPPLQYGGAVYATAYKGGKTITEFHPERDIR